MAANMGVYRRLPLYGRPVPFLACALMVAFGLYHGLNWRWDWSLQTGNIFVLILIPKNFFAFEGVRALWLSAAGVGLVGLFLVGTQRAASARLPFAGRAPWWRRASFRFYPLTLLLGLFLAYFGVVFMFDASVYGDKVPGGYAAFVYLDYAGLMDRPFVTTVGLVVTTIGLAGVLFAFRPGVGLPVPATPGPPRPVVPPSPTPSPAVPPPPPSPAPSLAPRTARSTLATSRPLASGARMRLVDPPVRVARLPDEYLE